MKKLTIMHTYRFILTTFLFLVLVAQGIRAEKFPYDTKTSATVKNKAESCTPATGKMDLSINNVRARIMTGGDMWWDLQGKAKYEIPKGSGKTSMFAASLWIAGLDVNQQLKCAALRFRGKGSDYWPGPLSTDGTAAVSPETCLKYDKLFAINKSDVVAFLADFNDNKKIDNAIPRSILDWPAHGDLTKGQSYYLAPFFDMNNDGRYNPYDGDYPYYDLDGSLCPATNKNKPIAATRETESGIVSGGILADQVLKGDQTLWWVFNDKGNVHTETGGEAIGLEIRAQAFGFATNDEINNMTFYSYEIINRSTYRLTDTYFSQWVDTDLGYSEDDYVGCDVSRGLGYCYNGKSIDGTGRTEHYGNQPPAIGVDFFQGPYMDADGKDNPKYDGSGKQLCDESINGVNFGDGIIDNERYGMRRFVYHDNSTGVNGDPQTAIEYYNYLRGIWRDNSKMVYGGTAHRNDPTATAIETDFMFPGNSDPCNWATGGKPTGFPKAGQYWTEEQAGNKPYDRRFMQSAGPFTLEPGAVNYITVGIPWARAASGGPFASVELLRQVDDKCQRLFDNCFQIVEGPDAPDLVVQEMDKELILFITNRKTNANANENYAIYDPRIISPDTLPSVNVDALTGKNQVTNRYDSTYNFEGYQIYQLKDATVSSADLKDPDKARLVAQCDIKNGVSKLVNYYYSDDLGGNVPVLEVEGADKGIAHTFKITEDKFATGDKGLVNYKQYYFMAIAYAYNEFLPYSQEPGVMNGLHGQKQPYLASRKNQSGGAITPITAIPHNPAIEENGTVMNALFGDTPEITRLEGHGNGSNILELTESTIDQIIANTSAEQLTYQKNKGPVNVKIIDPLNVVGTDYTLAMKFSSEEVKLTGTDTTIFFNGSVDTASKIMIDRTYWLLTDVTSNKSYTSDMDIERIYKYMPVGNTRYIAYDTLRTANEQLFIDIGIAVTIEQDGEELVYPTYHDGINCYGTTAQDNINLILDIPVLESSLTFKDSTKQWLTGVPDLDGSTPWNWIRSGTLDDGEDPTNNDNNEEVFVSEKCDNFGEYTKFFWDKDERFEKLISGTWAPAKMTSFQKYGPMPKSTSILRKNSFANLSSVNIVFTSDQTKWTRCPIIELSEDNKLSEGNKAKFSLRAGKNVGKDGAPDGTTVNGYDYGMGWFPGYAINVETGERLNLFFGEDSWLVGENGRDMKWNPTSKYSSLNQILFGGRHTIYIMNSTGVSDTTCPAYDEGVWLNKRLTGNAVDRRIAFQNVMWIGMPMLAEGKELLSTDATIKLRVGKPYKRYLSYGKASAAAPQNDNYPMYSFSTKNMATVTDQSDTAKSLLDLIMVTPNPYYSYSGYETSQLDNRIKILNLPQTCTISIYTLNGLLVRQYKKDNDLTYIDWDLKNHAGIPISGGMYLIHVNAPDIGEKVIKWFGVLRPTDLNTF